MAKLPDKFSLGARPVPQGGRGVVGIAMDSPMAAAGERLGRTVAGFGAALEQRAEAEDRLKVAAATSSFLERKIGLEAAFAKDSDYDTAEPRFAAALQQARAQATAGLSERQVARFEAQAQPLAQQGLARLRTRVAEGRRQVEETRLSETLTGSLEALKSAGLADQATGLATTAALLKAAAEQGTITPEQARELGRRYAQGLDLHNFDRLPPEQRLARLEALEAGKGGAGPGATFDAALRQKKREEAVAERQRQESQARSKAERDRIEGAARAALDRYGSSPEGEEQGRAALRGQFGDKAGPADRLYDGLLQARRVEERRGDAQAAATVYQLALAGRETEIAPADAKRLHEAGQLDGILDAAQYARSANPQGDLLFKERLLAMTPQQRAGYGLGELAKRLSPQDFAEVAKAAAEGKENEAERARMEGFVQQVRPMLRSVTLGELASPDEVDRDWRLLDLIREEVGMTVTKAEKKKNAPLTPSEYQDVMRYAIDRVALHHIRPEVKNYVGVAEDGLEDGIADNRIDLGESNGKNASIDINEAEGEFGTFFPTVDEQSIVPKAQGDTLYGIPEGTNESFDPETGAYLATALLTNDSGSDESDSGPGVLLAQYRGGNRGARGGILGGSGRSERDARFEWHINSIRKLEPNNPQLSYIRDPKVPIGEEGLINVRRELEAAAFRFATQISFGHGFKEHGWQFGRNVTRGDYAAIAQSVIMNPKNRVKDLGSGFFAYYDNSRNIVVFVDPTTSDRGSMFRPSGGRRFFDNLKIGERQR